MLDNCPSCGRYTLQQPCYECLKKERDELKALLDTDLANELQKYRTLYNLAARTCGLCRENCAIRGAAREAAATLSSGEAE